MKNLTPVKSVRNKLKKIQIQIEQDEAQPEGKQSTDLRIKKTQVCAKKHRSSTNSFSAFYLIENIYQSNERVQSRAEHV